MVNKMNTLDRLFLKIIKASLVTRSPKLQYFLGCLFTLFSGVSLAADGVAKGDLGFISNSINNRIGNVPGNKFISNFNFDYQKTETDLEKQSIDRKLTVALQQNDAGLLQYSLQEAYLGGHLTNKDFIRIGRMNLDWSSLDATWGFGKLNNRRNFDFFTPGQEGLTGLAYEHRSSNGLRFKLFGSGLYIPELNPPYQINKHNKTIKCNSPWCDPPPTHNPYKGTDKQIDYDVNYPSASDIVFRYSFGFNVGWEDKHWKWDNFFIHKPENQVTTQASAQLNSFTDHVVVTVNPKVYYHDMFGSTLKYQNQDLQMYFGGFGTKPNSSPGNTDEVTRLTEIKSNKIREDYVGGGISKTNSEYTLGFNYVARLSSYNRDQEPLIPDPRWNQALNVFMTRNLGKLTLSADAKYDMLTRDRLVMVRAFMNLTQSLLLNLGMNLIGTPSDGKSFWSPYTNNDSLNFGLKYVF